MTFEGSGEEIEYREKLSKALHQLQTKHLEYFRIINVSERRYDILQMNQPGQVTTSRIFALILQPKVCQNFLSSVTLCENNL